MLYFGMFSQIRRKSQTFVQLQIQEPSQDSWHKFQYPRILLSLGGQSCQHYKTRSQTWSCSSAGRRGTRCGRSCRWSSPGKVESRWLSQCSSKPPGKKSGRRENLPFLLLPFEEPSLTQGCRSRCREARCPLCSVGRLGSHLRDSHSKQGEDRSTHNSTFLFVNCKWKLDGENFNNTFIWM